MLFELNWLSAHIVLKEKIFNIDQIHYFLNSGLRNKQLFAKFKHAFYFSKQIFAADTASIASIIVPIILELAMNKNEKK